MNKTKISFSKATTFTTCGRKYELQYLKRMRPKKTGSPLLFGGAIDKSLNTLLLTKDLQKAKDVFSKEWNFGTINGILEYLPDSSNIKYSKNDLDNDLLVANDFNIELHKNESWFSLYHKGLLMLEAYERKVLPKINKVICVQEPISIFNKDGDEIPGFLDMILDWGNLGNVLADNKTTSVKYDSDSAQKSPQLNIYHYAKKAQYKLSDNIMFITLDKRIKKIRICETCGVPSPTTHRTCNAKTRGVRCEGKFNISFDVNIDYIINKVDPKYVKETIQMFDVSNDGISNKDFEPNYSSCDTKYGPCDFKKFCWDNDSSDLIILPKEKK